MISFILLVLLNDAVQRSWTIGLGSKRHGGQVQHRSGNDGGDKLFHGELPDHAFHAKRCALRGTYRRENPGASSHIQRNSRVDDATVSSSVRASRRLYATVHTRVDGNT